MVKKKNIRKAKTPQEKPEEKTLEKEIDELIAREKAKSKIVKIVISHIFHIKSTVILILRCLPVFQKFSVGKVFLIENGLFTTFFVKSIK